MALIISETQGAASSSDFTLAAGAATTLSLTGAAKPLGSAQVQRVVGSTAVTIGELNDGRPAAVLSAVGTFRVTKGPSQNATGVDRD